MKGFIKRCCCVAVAAMTLVSAAAFGGRINTWDISAADDMVVNGITIPSLDIQQKYVPETEGIKFVEDMRLGWNLGNTLDSIDDNGYISNEMALETYWNGGFKTTQRMIDTVKSAGFNTIRIPVSWHNHVDGNYNISEQWMNRVQEVVDYAVKNDMYIILNVHHDNDQKHMYPTSAHYERSSKYMTTVWKQIATRFKDYNEKLIFETMNEPRMTNHPNEWWLNMASQECIDAVQTINKLNQDIVNTIRATGGNNATRYIGIPGYDCSVEGATNSYFKLPEDTAKDKLIVAVHGYLPVNFALTEANQNGSTDKFDLNKDTGEINQAMDTVYNKYISKGIPVYVGEMGVRDKNNLQARVDCAAYYVAYAASRGITCCWWDDISFMLLDRGSSTWRRPEIVAALNKYARGESTSTRPPEQDPGFADGEAHGSVTYNEEKAFYDISVPSASDTIYLNVELPDGATGASGCIANGFEKNGQYYWAMVSWNTQLGGVVPVNIDDNFQQLVCNDEPVEDEALIEEAKAYLKTITAFQAQIWWVGGATGLKTSDVKITDVYVYEDGATPPATEPPTTEPETTEPPTTEPETTEPPTTEPEVTEPSDILYGDADVNGKVDILDIIVLNKNLLGAGDLSDAGKANVDVDGDGKPTANDSLNILKFIVKLTDKLPIK